jgi:hypothetical protein
MSHRGAGLTLEREHWKPSRRARTHTCSKKNYGRKSPRLKLGAGEPDTPEHCAPHPPFTVPSNDG